MCLSQGEEIKTAKVIGRSKDADSNVIATYDNTPLVTQLSINE